MWSCCWNTSDVKKVGVAGGHGKFQKKTIVMFYVNCSEKKFSEKRKWASPLRPLGAK